ncbi:vesicle transport protein USE1 isoform X1 [Agrilus planipennis]|uniref:Vesicle transport protein USE1 n=1 Tax=Agrilus planipennis TaxID=224129 RepID=A0A1W4XMB3_AGRPL|nr:vesicle transport protein USE1 isoform X1 [Agrilus planipennis]
MVLSRTETNLRRLLAKCDLMVKTNQKGDERFPKYLDSLENMLKQLSELPEKPPREATAEYSKRITSLRILLGLNVSEELRKYQFENLPLTNTGVKENNDLSDREKLLGSLRQRQVYQATTGLDEIIDYNQQLQEKIAEEMLTMAKNLKEQSELANKIIKKDTEVISRSSQLSEENFIKLKTESSTLTEQSRKAWKCWLWILLLIVLVVFIYMVLFMKIMKKKR